MKIEQGRKSVTPKISSRKSKGRKIRRHLGIGRVAEPKQAATNIACIDLRVPKRLEISVAAEIWPTVLGMEMALLLRVESDGGSD